MRDILTVEDIVALMRSKSYIIDMGAKKVSKWLKVSEEAVKEARKVIRREKLLTEVPEHKKLAHVAPRILILDIETAPNRAYVWRFWRQNVYLDQIISN
jgi:predicted transcriptional regulator